MRLILLMSFLFIENTAVNLNEGWVAVQRGVDIDFNLEQYSLEIMTDSTLGSDDKVYVRFYTAQGDHVAALLLYFYSTPKYIIGKCSSNLANSNFPTNLPSANDKVWRVTLTRTSGIRLVIHCNEGEVLNTLMSDSTCVDSSWSTTWSKEIAKIKFSRTDTASEYYQPQPVRCTGLMAEWTSTIETAAKFPVDPETVVDVTCSDSGALNRGSSEVTCTSENVFTYSKEPFCLDLVCKDMRDLMMKL